MAPSQLLRSTPEKHQFSQLAIQSASRCTRQSASLVWLRALDSVNVLQPRVSRSPFARMDKGLVDKASEIRSMMRIRITAIGTWKCEAFGDRIDLLLG
jgi:hypothetical protein